MQKVKAMLHRLSNFYWSPNHPSTYVVTRGPTKGLYGIGLIASQSYGAFNLTWATSKADWATVAGQAQICDEFQRHKPITERKIRGVYLLDYLTLYKPKAFLNFINTEPSVPETLRSELNHLLGKVVS